MTTRSPGVGHRVQLIDRVHVPGAGLITVVDTARSMLTVSLDAGFSVDLPIDKQGTTWEYESGDPFATEE